MLIDRDQLKSLVVEVACREFAGRSFRRRELMNSVERRLRADGVWEPGDEEPSRSAGEKSQGLAAIDFAISDLKKDGRLSNPERDLWRVPARFWPALSARFGGDDPLWRNGISPGAAALAERLRRLERVSGRVAGPPIPDDALRREGVYETP